MAASIPDFAALIGSRICHDLISPLGAIGNGVELLAMTPAKGSPELALIADSVAHANARIRFFRLAFGAGSGAVSAAEVRSILADLTRGARITIDWQLADETPRARVKLAFLALLCLETALPRGGAITVRAEGGGLRAEARGARLAADGPVWAAIRGGAQEAEMSAALVQFALLPAEAAAQGGGVALDQAPDSLTLAF